MKIAFAIIIIKAAIYNIFQLFIVFHPVDIARTIFLHDIAFKHLGGTAYCWAVFCIEFFYGCRRRVAFIDPSVVINLLMASEIFNIIN